jgi:hypothetical protein
VYLCRGYGGYIGLKVLLYRVARRACIDDSRGVEERIVRLDIDVYNTAHNHLRFLPFVTIPSFHVVNFLVIPGLQSAFSMLEFKRHQ